jgi:hypothetical protein
MLDLNNFQQKGAGMIRPTFQLIVLASLAWACAPAPVKQWNSMPPVQKISTSFYTVQMEPLKKNNPYYVAFLIRIQNHSDNPLEVDWNRTRYLHNGEDLGVFVFRGINPDRIQGAIPSDSVFAGKIFSKEISPLKTVTFLPLYQAPEPGRRGFEPGILPAGKNSIRLALRQNGRNWQKTLTVRLFTEAEKP